MLAVQSKPLDASAAKFRGEFLKYGFAYAALVAVVGFVPLFVAGAPISLRLAFSPDFDSEKLQPPVIRLPDGTQAGHNAKFDMQPSAGTQVVTIGMDATLDQVRNLREASANLSTTVAKVTKQRDSLAAKAAEKRTSELGPTTPAL